MRLRTQSRRARLRVVRQLSRGLTPHTRFRHLRHRVFLSNNTRGTRRLPLGVGPLLGEIRRKCDSGLRTHPRRELYDYNDNFVEVSRPRSGPGIASTRHFLMDGVVPRPLTAEPTKQRLRTQDAPRKEPLRLRRQLRRGPATQDGF